MKMRKSARPGPPSIRGKRNRNRPGEETQRPQSSGSVDKIYGLIPVLEAFRSGSRQIDHIIIAEGARHERLRDLLALARAAKVPIHRVPGSYLDRSLGDTSHQGIVAKVAAARYADADELIERLVSQTGNAPSLGLGLDGIEDPRNLGAILRTAECAGVQGVFVPQRRAVGLTDIVAKAAAGAMEYVPVARVTNLVRLIQQLKERNIWVVGSAWEASQEYTDWDWTLPVVILLGNEGTGLHRLVRERCDSLVRIPLMGRLNSLNVSVAAGVLLYEVLRQRTAAKTQLR